jgi:SAM-dependent methyltransferase
MPTSVPFAAHSACPLCRQRQAIIVSQKDRYRQPLTTVACVHCGLFRTDPLPSEEDLYRFHEQDYRSAYKGARAPKAKNIYRSGRLALVRLRQLGPFPAGSRILDAGSGSGEWLYLLQCQGHSVKGIEADTAYGEFARATYGVSVWSGGLLEAELPPASFDIITSFHVLEHLPDPLGALRRLYSWLTPGGQLLIEVPNINSPHQNPAGRFHYAHVLGFTPESLAYAGASAGFTVESVSLDRFDRNLAIRLRRPTSEGVAVQAPATTQPPLVTSTATVARYYLRPATYLRWLLRMVQFGSELNALRTGATPREFIRSEAS